MLYVALPDSLVARLVSLEETVKGAEPISRAIAACRRLKADLAKRRDAQKRLGQYETASGALGNLLPLAELTDLQVEQLRLKLRSEASKWRNRVYLGAFPGTAHELVDASMSRRGELDLVVATGSVSAPAQHVTNASALRASLVGFFLAFWEHVLGERGGLRLLLLDDPQELLDDENRERLASALATLVAGGGQVVVTTNDPRFAMYVAKIPGKATAHHWVSPATKKQPLVRTPLSVAEVFRRKAVFEMDIDAEEPARAFAEACRVFLEATMGDLFDDPASSGWGAENPTPSLSAYVSRLRNLIRKSPLGMFGGGAFRKFAAHPALADGASTLKLLNKPHHQDRRSITPGEVAECANELSELVEMADRLHDECRRWRRREQDEIPKAAFAVVGKLPRLIFSNVDVNVCPDLAAFTQHHPVEESQGPTESLDVNLLLSKSLFYLRRDNFGFAAPKGAIAIVESEPLPVADRRLVIARHGDEVYARRFLRSEGSMIVGLTAETPDPRESPKTKFLPESELVLHQVVGVIFEHSLSIGPGREEALLVDAPEILKRAEIAYRIRESSAVPLALPKQIVLGGPLIELDQLGQHNNALVALSLADGSQIFKRVGAKLSGALAHLRQFESIGGLGASEILSVGKPQAGVLEISRARLIIGVLYSG